MRIKTSELPRICNSETSIEAMDFIEDSLIYCKECRPTAEKLIHHPYIRTAAPVSVIGNIAAGLTIKPKVQCASLQSAQITNGLSRVMRLFQMISAEVFPRFKKGKSLNIEPKVLCTHYKPSQTKHDMYAIWRNILTVPLLLYTCVAVIFILFAFNV